MSTSSTPQSATAAAVLSETHVERALRRPKLYLAILISGVFLFGIAISLLFGTSLDTSSLAPHHSRAYFARKSNIFNQLFVKRCWGWTSLVFLVHLVTAPPSPSIRFGASPAAADSSLPSRQTRRQRLGAFVVASTLWVVFTSWFFGAGLGDRIIALSGGRCAVALPSALEPAALDALLPSGGSLISGPGSTYYLPLPAAFCHLRQPITPASHPDLFQFVAPDTFAPSAADAGAARARFPHARWSGGFDISGHAFLLTLASLVLAQELAPSWSSVLDPRRVRRPLSPTSVAHTAATWAGTALVALWVWMLFMTSIFFHNPPEKMTGLVFGLLSALLVDVLTPSSLKSPVIEFMPPASPRPPSVRKSESPLSSPIEEDENSARRETTDDDLVDSIKDKSQ